MALEFKYLEPTLYNVLLCSTVAETHADDWITKLVVEKWFEVYDEGKLVGFTNYTDVIRFKGATHDNLRNRADGEAGGIVGVSDQPPTLLNRIKGMVARTWKRHSPKEGTSPVGVNGLEWGSACTLGVDVHNRLDNRSIELDVQEPESRAN